MKKRRRRRDGEERMMMMMKLRWWECVFVCTHLRWSFHWGWNPRPRSLVYLASSAAAAASWCCWIEACRVLTIGCSAPLSFPSPLVSWLWILLVPPYDVWAASQVLLQLLVLTSEPLSTFLLLQLLLISAIAWARNPLWTKTL